MRLFGPSASIRAWQRLVPRLPPLAMLRPQPFAGSRRFIPLRSFQPYFMLVPPVGFSPSEVHSLTSAAQRLSTRTSLLDLDPSDRSRLLHALWTRRPTELPSHLDTRKHRSTLTAETPKRFRLHQSRISVRSTREHRGALASIVQSSSATRVVAPRCSAFHRCAVCRACFESVAEAVLSSLTLGRPHIRYRAEARPPVRRQPTTFAG